LRAESLGVINIRDEGNDISCVITFGKVKKKPSDYYEGEIIYKGKKVCSVYGSYCGFIEFDGQRYWDYRDVLPYKSVVLKSKLESDHTKRKDRYFLLKGKLKNA
jgi:hypothetical protein